MELGVNIVQPEEGEKMRRKINANQFLECSARNYENINEVIYESIRAAVSGPPQPPPESCFDTFRRYICCSTEAHL